MPKQVVAGLRDFTPQYDFGVLLDGEGWVEAYATGSDVANMCRNLLASSSTFTASTVPTQAAVNSYLSSGCGILESTLQSKGYTVPVILADQRPAADAGHDRVVRARGSGLVREQVRGDAQRGHARHAL